ncbi:unnamed protein product [Cuscuta campestris]|uniref:GCK domain-containing protein n=1 Tax=Cuscuta campestris TaxID=132261 RepID=A0A484KA72_9ASTE|nr:unnamed protein product [Cuscuta campestris]
MGSVISSIVSENPKSSSASSSNPTTPIPKSPETDQSSVPKSPETDQSSVPKSPETDQSSVPKSPETDQSTEPGKQEEEEEEEEGECGFCVFMKGGDCKDAFTNWQDCIKEVETENTDIVKKCFDETSSLMKCIKEHPDYYGPILRAEKELEKDAKDSQRMEKEMADDFKDPHTTTAQSDG